MTRRDGATLFDGEEDGPGFHIIPGPEIHPDDPADLRGFDLVLHLHGLKDQDRLSLVDVVSFGR